MAVFWPDVPAAATLLGQWPSLHIERLLMLMLSFVCETALIGTDQED